MTRYVVKLRAPKKGERYVYDDTVWTAAYDYLVMRPVIIAEVPDDAVVVGRDDLELVLDIAGPTPARTAQDCHAWKRLRAALDIQKTAEVAAKPIGVDTISDQLARDVEDLKQRLSALEHCPDCPAASRRRHGCQD